MNIKAFLAAGAVALTMGASASLAATCSIGTCTTADPDGQLLSNFVEYDIDDIVGAGVAGPGQSGNFQFDGSFVQDTTVDAIGIAAYFESPELGLISNLMFNVTSPVGLVASYVLPQNTWIAIQLTPVVAPQVINFTLTGTATRGTAGSGQDPDINLVLEPVPVPAGILLMGTAIAGFGVMRRRKKAA